MKQKLKTGDDVLYQGKETHIECLYPEDRCLIANPDWDLEAECINNDIEYGIPYWITVKLSELTIITEM